MARRRRRRRLVAFDLVVIRLVRQSWHNSEVPVIVPIECLTNGKMYPENREKVSVDMGKSILLSGKKYPGVWEKVSEGWLASKPLTCV
jgi:hypothetical protein